VPNRAGFARRGAKIEVVAPPVTYCDFDVVVSRAGDGFEVRVLQSPAGETGAIRVSGNGLAPSPVEQGTTVGGDRDIGSSQRDSRTDRQQVGTSLFGVLFHGESLVRFRESRRLAAERGNGLRIVVRAGPSTDVLPWELLYDTEWRRFIALDPMTPVVRCIEMPTREPAPRLRGPLRMVVAVATPAGLSAIDAQRELRDLSAALDRFVSAGVLELVPLVDASLDDIRCALADGDVHILHYVGHGSRRADGRGVLQLTGGDGSPSARTGDELGAILTAAPGLRLVVLNSCHGAATAQDDPFAAPAAALVRAGVPAVLAMRHAVNDRAAIELSRAFYAELVAGAGVDHAITTARATLFARDDELAADWPTAALYLGSSLGAGLTGSPLPPIDEDVQFTISRPSQLRAARWESMLVFAHRAGPHVGAGGETVDPHEQVRQRVASFFGADAASVATTTEDAGAGVPRGAAMVVVPDLPDVESTPSQASITWTGELEEVRFLLRAGVHRVGSTVEGWVRVFCGPLLIAETTVRFDVVGDAETLPGLRPEPITSYRRIFPCFSPRDRELVANVAAVAEALGDRYTAHIIEGRSEGAPDDWMLPLIDEADVFQLFWSSHSMRSATCRRQWEAALATQRSGFIRPLYWEHPFPRDADVPPPALETLRFVRLPTPATASQQLWDGTPSAREPAPTRPDPRQRDRAPRRAAHHWLSSGGLAAVVGLVAAAVAAATVNFEGDADVPSIDPGPGGGDSAAIVVAVAAGAFVVAFALALVVIRAVRRRHD
jgi:hypothetical protein